MAAHRYDARLLTKTKGYVGPFTFQELEMRFVGLLAVALAVGGCAQTYSRNSVAVSGVNVTTISGEKAKGTWPVVIDESISNARRTGFKTTSQVCSGHTYNFDGSVALRSALQAASRELFEDTVLAKAATGANNVAFRLEEFNPRLSCQIGATEGVCTGTVEIGVSVLANVGGRRRSFTVNSQRSSDGPAGGLCEKALEVVEDATRRAAKDVAERAGERIATLLELPATAAAMPEPPQPTPVPARGADGVAATPTYVPGTASQPAPFPAPVDTRPPCGSAQTPGCRP
ncbi:hypothetical protein [uncultured Pseudacidovorax sp.]|uniref:hypothetical protein n=1 Tax=uncultured Pseudacidovorax sp. TaxID=679313 RepID=UPI0025F06D63|nr:hypothetical protein [uncultured Pseudacidovorax sp.]